MAEHTATVEMTGGGPWGFRLFGGDTDPLIVVKLRKRSKAHDSGLQEDDVLLAINSYTCQGMTHSNAMGLSEKDDTLILTVLRGTTEKDAVNAAFQNLGSEFKTLPASELPQSAPTLQVDTPSRGQSTSPRPSSTAWKVSDTSGGGGGAAPSVKREERSFQDGNQEKHITTETSTQKFGGTTLTKITREEVSRTKIGGGDTAEPKPVFQVPKFGGATQNKNGTWAPPGGSTTVKTGGVSITAPSGVHVQQNPDQSVTMTLGIHKPYEEGKENVAPYQQQPMFKVAKISQDNQPSQWKPSALQQQQPMFPLPKPKRFSPEPEMELKPDGSGRWGPQGDSMDQGPSEEPNVKPSSFNRNNAPMPLMLTKVLQEGVGSGSDECDTPTRKKKLFGDSAFYDDPDHKYPTIEEQVKMARKVAMSLTAPANVQARGHRMFVKRQKKAVKWTTGELEDMVDRMMEGEAFDDDVYGHPDPWKLKWEPPKVSAMTKPMEIPNPPPLPSGALWKAPNIPHVEDHEKTKALSADEFERMRLYDAKTNHTNIAPQACFALADALQHGVGKGGRLFAKRKERAETWVTDEDNVRSSPKPDMDMLRKIGAIPMGVPLDNPAGPQAKPGMPVNRLKTMVELPKAEMSPWEAAVDNPYGNLDKAFSHLDGYFAAKTKARVQDTLNSAVPPPMKKVDPFHGASPAAAGSLSPSSTASSGGPSRMPDYTRKIKPWGASAAEPASSSGLSSPQSFSGHETSAPSRPAAPWAQQQQPSSLSPTPRHGDATYRPAKFQPAPGVTRTGSWQPGSGAAASPVPPGGEASAGICDL